MSEGAHTTYTLHPFTANPSLALHGTVERCGAILRCRYIFEGKVEVEDVIIPPLSRQPSRRGGLWQETCCEIFMKTAESPEYWEFNLSPSGDWNVYHFTSYRTEMMEERRIGALGVTVDTSRNPLEIECKVDLPPLGLEGQGLRLAISAVTVHRKRPPNYWALYHPGPRPDFHLPAGFLLKLER